MEVININRLAYNSYQFPSTDYGDYGNKGNVLASPQPLEINYAPLDDRILSQNILGGLDDNNQSI